MLKNKTKYFRDLKSHEPKEDIISETCLVNKTFFNHINNHVKYFFIKVWPPDLLKNQGWINEKRNQAPARQADNLS